MSLVYCILEEHFPHYTAIEVGRLSAGHKYELLQVSDIARRRVLKAYRTAAQVHYRAHENPRRYSNDCWGKMIVVLT